MLPFCNWQSSQFGCICFVIALHNVVSNKHRRKSKNTPALHFLLICSRHLGHNEPARIRTRWTGVVYARKTGYLQNASHLCIFGIKAISGPHLSCLCSGSRACWCAWWELPPLARLQGKPLAPSTKLTPNLWSSYFLQIIYAS